VTMVSDNPYSHFKVPNPTASPNVSTKSVRTYITHQLIANLDLSTDELMDRLLQEGYQLSRLAASELRSSIRHTLKLVKELGLLKERSAADQVMQLLSSGLKQSEIALKLNLSEGRISQIVKTAKGGLSGGKGRYD
jgi:DNA-binding NarL/FixJ family response regulator